ncbi:hypothetical protein T05_5426, partial [Trichinella murrelli]
LTHPGAPLRRNTSIYGSSGDHGELSSGRARSVVAVTIRARMMATRRRDRGSEDESAKSNSGGRTGADVEADPAAAPGGTLHNA